MFAFLLPSREVALPEKEKSFEENLKALDEIVAKLEQGDLPLDEAIQAFQEGMRLTKLCSARLTAVEAEIKKLVVENGKFKLETFKTEDA